jgi:hypothetical protein
VTSPLELYPGRVDDIDHGQDQQYKGEDGR